MRLTHVRLLVDDYERALRFYRDVMGFGVLIDASEIFYSEFAAGDSVLAIYDRTMMERVVGIDALAGRSAMVTFDVEDVDDAFECVRGDGARPISEPHDEPTWGFRIAVVADPEGNLLELNHRLEQG